MNENLEKEILSELSTLLLKEGVCAIAFDFILNVNTTTQRRPFEVPRALALSTTQWTEANGLMTPSNKISRRALHAHFKNELNALYERAERRMKEETERKEREVSNIVAELTGQKVAGSSTLLDVLLQASVCLSIRETDDIRFAIIGPGFSFRCVACIAPPLDV